MHGVAELLRGRVAGVVAAERRIVGLVTVRAPVPFVLAGFGIEDDHPMIAVAIGDVQLVGLWIDEHLGGALEVLGVVAALALAWLADLHQELAGLGELQNHVVVVW